MISAFTKDLLLASPPLRNASLAQAAVEAYLHTIERGHPHIQEHTIQNRHGDKLERKTMKTGSKQQ